MRDTKKDWTTKAGLRAVILFVNDSHHCGYVAVPEGHALHGVDYGTKVPGLNVSEDTEVGKRSPITFFCAAASGDPLSDVSPDLYLDVHGGITYSGRGGEYPAEGEGLWWFGFDCAHAGDATAHISFAGDVFRDVGYVAAECESLAEQLDGILLDTCPESAA